MEHCPGCANVSMGVAAERFLHMVRYGFEKHYGAAGITMYRKVIEHGIPPTWLGTWEDENETPADDEPEVEERQTMIP